MELHERFMKIAGLELSIIEKLKNVSALQDSVDSILTKSIQNCLDNLKTGLTEENLKSLRLHYCLLYKFNYMLGTNSKVRYSSKLNQFIEFFANDRLQISQENETILCDVVVLHLVLFEDQKDFINLFEDFKTFNLQSTGKLSTNCYFKLLKCFLEFWEMLDFLNLNIHPDTVHRAHLESCKKVLIASVMYDLQSCVQSEGTFHWQSLYSVVQKVVGIAKSTKILSPFFRQLPFDKSSTLTTLCTLCDFVFPVDSSFVDVDHKLILNQDLWFMIKNGIISGKSSERKQALYLFKRLADFAVANGVEIKKAKILSEHKFNPFICDASGKRTTLPIEELIVNFILIVEALEEKQKHLIIPSLSLVSSLEKGWLEHSECGKCFSSHWIYCVYAKLLRHDNNSINKWGLLRLLKSNSIVYDDMDFLTLIVEALNNTFLYEKGVDESDSEISLALRDWFLGHGDSIKTFIRHSKRVMWAPVPIFFVLNSLSDVATTNESANKMPKWEKDDLDSTRSLVETSLKLHPPMLRSMSQVALIKVTSRFYEIENLKVLSNFLSVFFEKDILQPSCWSALTAWVAKVDHNVALDFVRDVCQELSRNVDSDDGSAFALALTIQLLYEGKVAGKTEGCLITKELSNLFSCLDNIDVRPYVDITFTLNVLDLIYGVSSLQRPAPDLFSRYLTTQSATISKFILRQLNNPRLTYKQAQICAKVFKSIADVSDLEEKCLRVLTENEPNRRGKVQSLLALQLWSNSSESRVYENKFLFDVVTKLLKASSPNNRDIDESTTQTIGQDYQIALCKIVRNHVLTKLNAATVDSSEIDGWLDILSSLLDTMGNQALAYISDVIHRYGCKSESKELEKFKLFVKSCWSCNFGSKRDKTFWLASQKLTGCINSSDFANSETLRELSKEFTNRMLSEGEALPALKYILLTCSDVESNFGHFAEVLLNGLLHGQVLRRDQRIGVQACVRGRHLIAPYKSKDGKIENFNAYDFLNKQCNVDTAIRAAAILRLCKAIQRNGCSADASAILLGLLDRLSTVKKKRYFADSPLHRLKHRIFQALLVLQPYLNEKSTKTLYDALRDSLIQDTDQHSVRLMKEWLLIRIYLSNENLLANIWSFFDDVYRERQGSVSSVIGIIWHVARRLSGEKLTGFVGTALAKLGLCGMGQQFGMRLFGQVFFVKLYELLGDENSSIRLDYSTFYEATLKSLNSGNFKKNPVKIDDDFFYTVFDPLEHYTLETIYHQLPRLSNVSFDEWITEENFKEQMLLDNFKADLNIANSDTLLNQAKIPYSILKANEQSKPEEIECTESINDIQKKIRPPQAYEDDSWEVSGSDEMRSKQNIMIIASLVEKSQNLGGITRTCEIFGVKELVISNYKQMEDKDFQALSVSADKWLKITEIKPFFLDKHLLELKNSGWTLVGAEQTANSVNLFDFKFPNKTALVLGNEKNGIPANIIPLLDLCVEIPQFGVIRSLNVHVTSAICIWEYVKQHKCTT